MHKIDWLHEGWPNIWLPYAQMQTTTQPLPVVGASGCTLQLADGSSLIDGVSAWWSMCHGYQHPGIVAAIQAQAGTLSHVMFAGLAHEPAYVLAKQLCAMAPAGLTRCFFSDSGSTAVEVSLKMALQYWHNQGQPKKSKFICFNGGYHGDTFGAMSVSARGGMHHAFDALTLKNYAIDLPNDEYSFAEFEETVAAIAPTVAALIIEPLVQGAGGMKFHSADVLAEIRRVCRDHNILFIADEIMTGFYRTGSRFACDEAGITPDIMCLGKALTGGHIGLAATLATDAVFDAFLSDDLSHALMHGPTFMANPIACAAANASLQLFAQHDYGAKVEAIERQFQRGLAACDHMRGVKDVRIKGAIGVVQIAANQTQMFGLREQFIERGLWLRPYSDLVYLMPPLTISEEELAALIDGVVGVVGEWSKVQ